MPKKKTRKKTPKKKTTQKDSSFTHEVLNTKYDEEAVVDILQNLRTKAKKPQINAHIFRCTISIINL